MYDPDETALLKIFTDEYDIAMKCNRWENMESDTQINTKESSVDATPPIDQARVEIIHEVSASKMHEQAPRSING